MLRRTIVCAVLLLAAVSFLSCTKMPEEQVRTEGRLAMEVAELKGGIPLAWGNVISVCSINRSLDWVQVWFQDNDGNIYMIPYHVEANVFHDNYRYMKRQ